MALLGYFAVLCFILCIISFILGGVLLILYVSDDKQSYLKPAKIWVLLGFIFMLLFIFVSKIFLMNI